MAGFGKDLVIHGPGDVCYYAVTIPDTELDSAVFHDLILNYHEFDAMSGKDFMSAIQGQNLLDFEKTAAECYLNSDDNMTRTIVLKFENQAELNQYRGVAKREILTTYKKCKKEHTNGNYKPLYAVDSVEISDVQIFEKPIENSNSSYVLVYVAIKDDSLDLDALERLDSIMPHQKVEMYARNEGPTQVLNAEDCKELESLISNNPQSYLAFNMISSNEDINVLKADIYERIQKLLDQYTKSKKVVEVTMPKPKFHEKKGKFNLKKILAAVGGALVVTAACGIIGHGFSLSKSSNTYQVEEMATTDLPNDANIDEKDVEVVVQINDTIEKFASNWLSKLPNADIDYHIVADAFYVLNYDYFKNNPDYEIYNTKYENHNLMNSYNQFASFVYTSASNGVYYDLSSFSLSDHGKQLLSSMFQSITSIDKDVQLDQMDNAMNHMQEFISNYIKNYYTSLENGSFETSMQLKLYIQYLMQYHAYPIHEDMLIKSLNQANVPIPSQDYNVILEDVQSSLLYLELPSAQKSR